MAERLDLVAGQAAAPHRRLVLGAEEVGKPIDGDGFAAEEILDRAPETGIADPVGAVRRLRQVAALNLVRSLGAGLHALQAVVNGEFDGAVVARFEMQERPIADATPVAAVERVGPNEIES